MQNTLICYIRTFIYKVITYQLYPTGKSDEEFIKTAKVIEEKIKDLALRIKNNEL